MKKPQVIAANKMDAVYGDSNEIITLLKETYEPQGIPVFPISAVSGQGLKELIYYVHKLLEEIDDEPIVFEPEFSMTDLIKKDESFTVSYDEEEEEYVVEGPAIEKMLGYTSIDSEKGFLFFQRFLKDRGILDQLEEAGIQEGDTVRMYGLSFNYYK